MTLCLFGVAHLILHILCTLCVSLVRWMIFFLFNFCDFFFCLTFGWLFFLSSTFLYVLRQFSLYHKFLTQTFHWQMTAINFLLQSHFCIYFGQMHIHLLLPPLLLLLKEKKMPVCIANSSSCFSFVVSLNFKRQPNYVSRLFLCRCVDNT